MHLPAGQYRFSLFFTAPYSPDYKHRCGLLKPLDALNVLNFAAIPVTITPGVRPGMTGTDLEGSSGLDRIDACGKHDLNLMGLRCKRLDNFEGNSLRIEALPPPLLMQN